MLVGTGFGNCGSVNGNFIDIFGNHSFGHYFADYYFDATVETEISRTRFGFLAQWLRVVVVAARTLVGFRMIDFDQFELVGKICLDNRKRREN